MEEDNTNTLLAEIENFHISTKSPSKLNIKVCIYFVIVIMFDRKQFL